MPKQKQKYTHTPVLVNEVVNCLGPKPGQSYLDLTAGYGGHSSAILRQTEAYTAAVLVDRDEIAIASLRDQFASRGAEIVHSDYLGALVKLAQQARNFDMVLADLGVSSPHLEDSQRGFAFSQAGPLDMRMDLRQEKQADEIVNNISEAELAGLLRTYGEEPRAKTIAKAIVNARPVANTQDLAAIIAKTAGFRARHSKIHPATKAFQAIRIAVNDELNQLEQGLPLMLEVLAPGGRLAIISFHSLEDRLVKQFLADKAGNRYDAELTLLTKKPITASHNELVSNPRARSAKLRAAAKIKNQKKG